MTSQDASQRSAVTQQHASSHQEAEPTVAHTPGQTGSRGLHIRCPHCSNPVELVSDTPYESVTCQTCGSAFSLVEREDQTTGAPVLKSIGRFELVSRLGVGGFGTVWKARDTELDRTVAVKIPRKGQLAPHEIEQFFREARSAAQLRHPNIVPVHEVGRDADTIFIVCDLIRGVSLSDWLSINSPTVSEIAALAATIATALEHAHEQGVIHRDLKPTNILMDEQDQPYLMDFGLAKREMGEITMTVDGQILGTPAYMSPEQAGGGGHWTDRRTDIYSMGVTLFRMLTGELPFRGNAQTQIHQRLTEDPPDPRKLNRFLPRDICTICLKCMERDPNRRYATAQQLADELTRVVRGEPILSRPISRTERLIRWARRKPTLAIAASLTIFLAIAGPATALIIESQRQRLSELLAEKNNLIAGYADDKEADANQISLVQGQLDLWEGRANPWHFWPPSQAENPHKVLLENVLDDSSGFVDRVRQAAGSDLQLRTLGHLALAMMSDEAQRGDQAVEHYQLAKEQLLELAQRQPENTRYAQALADCCSQLARLSLDSDRRQAEQNLSEARAIQHRLADQNPDPQFAAGLLDAELKSAVMRGFDQAAEHLDRAQQLSGGFPDRVPSDPTKLYELACFLCRRSPVLLAQDDQAE